MKLRWLVHTGPHGLRTDPVLQQYTEKTGEYEDIPVVAIKNPEHMRAKFEPKKTVN